MSVSDKLHELRRVATRVRNGLHPASAAKMAVRRYDDIRFHGVRVSGPNRPVLVDTILTVWAGEYDGRGLGPRAGESVVDVGANIGAFAMLAAARGADVAAYEPHPETFGHLQSNTAAWKVRCRQAAVVAQPAAGGLVTLWTHPTHSTRHTLLAGPIEGEDPSGSYDVEAVLLADAIGDGCDLLKLDCEGAEHELLLETPAEALGRARRIVAEVHEESGPASALVERLASLGFEVELERKDGHPLAMLYATRS